jgi:phosphatidylethanolamine/phosphatidyl-N-methylethanolamine N-methyltransferase
MDRCGLPAAIRTVQGAAHSVTASELDGQQLVSAGNRASAGVQHRRREDVHAGFRRGTGCVLVKNGYHLPAELRPLAARFSLTHPEGPARPPLSLGAVLSAYRRYARAYDVVFGPVFQAGRLTTVKRINELGRVNVLEVGVGTGLSMSRYTAAESITGIDVSRDMLSIAKRRVQAQGLQHRVSLIEMDAEHLAFADNQFDVVVAMYVVSVTPDPRRCLAEMYRVCRPGGMIFICNHFARENRWSLTALHSLSKWLGWRPYFQLRDLLDGERPEIVLRERIPPFGLFTLMALRNDRS